MPTMTYPTTAGEQTSIEVTGGVDTHKDTHTAAALDASGRLVGRREFGAIAAGYAALLAWLGTLGQLVRVGVEGSGVYGAGLARFLQAAGVELVEVDRSDRKARRRQGKSDPVDAEAAARAAQAGRAGGVPKTRGGKVDALRALRVARRSAVAARAGAQRQIKALIVTVPDALRMALRGLGDRELIAQCATRRPDRAAAGVRPACFRHRRPVDARVGGAGSGADRAGPGRARPRWSPRNSRPPSSRSRWCCRASTQRLRRGSGRAAALARPSLTTPAPVLGRPGDVHLAALTYLISWAH